MIAQGLYDPANEHDACGVGFIAHIKGNKSHSIIEQGLLILKNLDHRGAVGADPLMGDGAGILIQIPDQYFRDEMAKQGVELPPPGEYGVGMVFLPKEHASRIACEQEIERAVRAEGQVVLGWRNVPVDDAMPMSPTVRAKEPVIRQIFIGRGPDVMVTDALERKLYVIRKSSGHAIQALKLMHGKEFFVPSMSARTIVYKGLLLADQVGVYYKDLQDPRCVSALALVHQRFSTNTFPEWPLAHPYRLIAHNGEINTVKGNFNWTRAREGVMKSAVLGDDLKKLFPLIYEGQSDTACFDNALELLVMAGYPIAQAMMMMIPEAWENHALDGREPPRLLRIPRRDDGAVGRPGRHGLHRRPPHRRHAGPQRPASGALHRDRRRPGGDGVGIRRAADPGIAHRQEMAPAAGQDVPDRPRSRPHHRRQGTEGHLRQRQALQGLDQVGAHQAQRNQAVGKPAGAEPRQGRRQGEKAAISLLDRQQAFGYTQEDLKFLMAPMAVLGEEATGSMGNDSPLAVMSNKLKPLYSYFKQLFAQVTNPPIDPIREAMVMSLVSFIGPKPNLLDTNNVNPPMRLEVSQPILGFDDMARLRNISLHTGGKFKSYELNICYPVAWGKEGIEARLASLCAEAVDAVKSGHNILIVSDRAMNGDQVAIPALLATSADPPAPGDARPARLDRPGGRNRLGPRDPPLRAAGRLRRRSRAPVPGAGDPGRPGRTPAAAQTCRPRRRSTTTPRRSARA